MLFDFLRSKNRDIEFHGLSSREAYGEEDNDPDYAPSSKRSPQKSPSIRRPEKIVDASSSSEEEEEEPPQPPPPTQGSSDMEVDKEGEEEEEQRRKKQRQQQTQHQTKQKPKRK